MSVAETIECPKLKEITDLLDDIKSLFLKHPEEKAGYDRYLKRLQYLRNDLERDVKQAIWWSKLE